MRPIVLTLTLKSGERVAVNLQHVIMAKEISPKADTTELHLVTGIEIEVQGSWDDFILQAVRAIFDQAHDNMRS